LQTVPNIGFGWIADIAIRHASESCRRKIVAIAFCMAGRLLPADRREQPGSRRVQAGLPRAFFQLTLYRQRPEAGGVRPDAAISDENVSGQREKLQAKCPQPMEKNA
jgi:hypothetical protein